MYCNVGNSDLCDNDIQLYGGIGHSVTKNFRDTSSSLILGKMVGLPFNMWERVPFVTCKSGRTNVAVTKGTGVIRVET